MTEPAPLTTKEKTLITLEIMLFSVAAGFLIWLSQIPPASQHIYKVTLTQPQRDSICAGSVHINISEHQIKQQ